MILNTIQALELCQRALIIDDTDEDAKSLKSFLIAHGLNSKVIGVPDNLATSYKTLVSVHGAHFLVDTKGKQV